MNIPVLIQSDQYKMSHYKMYPEGTSKIYSNLTPRKSRFPEIKGIVVFGVQYFILEYLIKQWNKNFFGYAKFQGRQVRGDESQRDFIISKYKRMMDHTLGKDSVDTEHIEDLWDLGYLPLEIKALPEGTVCPIGVPCMTITNTVDHAYWLVNYLETILSCTVWQPITSATIAYEFKKLLDKYALETTGSTDFVQFQGHDFSMRGMSSLESACTSGAGHLLSFVGTDTIPAIEFLEQYYEANIEEELVGTSVPATEHSVECMNAQGTMDGEYEHTLRLLRLYPTGIVSKVSDTTDLWSYITQVLPKCKSEIMSREGKLVIRPDSGDPVDIICGTMHRDLSLYKVKDRFFEKGSESGDGQYFSDDIDFIITPEHKGVIELLWDTFGGTINEQGYKVLDSHVGAIYGDSINMERATQICERLKAKGFASTNIVFGIGSYTYQMNTRDTFGFAVKATYGEVTKKVTKYTEDGLDYKGYEIESREIFKDPITDDGTKKSKKGLLQVLREMDTGGELMCMDQCTKEQEEYSMLDTVFLDGKLIKKQTLKEIRDRLWGR